MTIIETETISRCRADTIGSLLRPAALLDAFAEADAGRLDAQGLRQAQDRAVRDVVREQEAHGLPVVTDGEFRRRHFQESFGELSGFAHGLGSPVVLPEFKEVSPGRVGIVGGRFPTVATSDRLRLTFNRPLEEFIFARALTNTVVKASLMTPNRIVEIFDAEKSTDVYPDVDAFRADVVAVQREMIAQLIRAGCEYIHIDAPGYASWVDPSFLDAMRKRGEDPDTRLEQAIATDNAVIDGFDDVTFALHVCRGNVAGLWGREGGYDGVAERLYNGLKHERLLLEYDSPRAGSFDSLRFVPEGKIAVLGLISTKTGELESVNELKLRVEEASRFLAIDQLAISCQCGFGSIMGGNPLTVDQQWAKLDRMLEVADEIWS